MSYFVLPDSQSSFAIQYQASKDFLPILEHLGASLLVSTYKLGQVALIQPGTSGLSVSMKKFPRAMGLSSGPTFLAIGSRRSVWYLLQERELPIPNPGEKPTKLALVARKQWITGDISIHELAWHGEELWAVNTMFSCLCTFDDKHNFVPRWKPDFVSVLKPGDRCHLNGMAMGADGPQYVSVLGVSDEPGGWRERKVDGGCLIDVGSNETILENLSMPHSPRLHDGKLFFLNSGHGQINVADPIAGTSDVIDQVPGYTRGMCFAGQFAFVGMSQIRETNVFGGLPIGEKASELRCGVVVVDLRSGKSVAWFQFDRDVEEVFAVEVLPDSTPTVMRTADPEEDEKELWVIPPLGKGFKGRN